MDNTSRIIYYFSVSIFTMADITPYLPLLKQEEGGFSDRPNDKGGPTNLGITLAEFQHYYGADKTVDDLKAMTDDEWLPIVKEEYWNAVKADNINDQQVAVAIVDFGFNSGQGTAVIKVQEILKVTPVSGYLGSITLAAINNADAETLCNAIADSREAYDRAIVANNPSQEGFLAGWISRTNRLRYKPAA